MSKEYKKYDTEDSWVIHNGRLTADAEWITDEAVKVTMVSTSRNDNDADIWVDIILGGGQADYASRLKKGDIISATGKLTMHRFGDDHEKVGFQLRLPRVHYALPLLQELGERGESGGKSKKAKPARGRSRRAEPDREVIDLDDEED